MEIMATSLVHHKLASVTVHMYTSGRVGAGLTHLLTNLIRLVPRKTRHDM